MKNIIYINTDTDITSNLFNTQVNILKSFCPKNYSIQFVNIRNIFSKKKLNCEDIYGWPMRYSNNFMWCIPLVISSIFISMKLYLKRKNTIFVGRGYYGGLIGLFLSIIWKQTFVWDPRSIYTLEELGSGKFKKPSLIFCLWIKLERMIVKNSNAIIAVSMGHKKYYNLVSQKYHKIKTPIYIVPCYAEQYKLHNKDNTFITSIFSSFPYNSINIAYCGSLDRKWNNIDLYVEAFSELIKEGYCLVILTQSEVNTYIYKNISKMINIEKNILKQKIKILNISDIKIQHLVLKRADYGIMLMDKVPDWFSRLGVKLSMYRIAGLPVIISKYFGGAINLLKSIDDFNIIIYDKKNIPKLRKLPDKLRITITKNSMQIFNPSNFFSAISNLKSNNE